MVEILISGKTTLAQLLFNNDKVKNHFELRNWICVSDPFDQKRIAKAILENAGKSSQESELDPLIQRIKETFSGKRFLLVLDDVWTEDDSKWEPFQNSLKDGAPGSVILVTTRSHRVAAVVGTTHTHQMALMSDSDCWLIMQRIAFANKSGDLCKKVERIGQKIAEKCKGLPLAAKTMGSLLRLKDTIQQWQNVLDSEIWQLEEELSPEQQLFPHLYLSYNELSPELKRCFSYCAVFPKDHEIYVMKLILLWIAQGYVRPRQRGERLELVGREYFNNLAMRSFFQELKKVGDEYMKCKMHDIVHDFAQFLTKNECHALDGFGRNSSSERARHLTILEEGTEEEMFSSRVVDFGRLRSFLTFFEIGRVVVPLDLFRSLKCVRTLVLSSCELAEIPAEIGRLIHLRHLDLSRNPFVTLPETVCDLYYLEILDINDCQMLSCLPERIEGLVHLRHLLNHETPELRQIPQGLGKLTSLCSLSRFIARSNSDDLTILKDLNQLELLHIEIEGEIDFRNAKFRKKVNMRGMDLLFRSGAHFIETPSYIESIEPPPNLEGLWLFNYPGAQLPSWLVTKSHANNLTRLIIYGPRNISSLPALWKLSSLEELELGEVEKLECLGKEFFGSSFSAEALAFPNLRKLHFHHFQNWTNWEDLSEDDEEVAISIMPRLEELEISQCTKLEALPHRILGKISSLKNLDIRYCNKLRDRYSDKTGDDWIKISHIPQVHISDY
ncbi:unnamed protein product [Coffea canephora]|uniref:Uncharacterized protein n=1 Tax=Coffea canephora TaxID=49390 RepID=A0A068VEJ9_COFCA|nr:unnamed protein product [Coffea canephora]